jgi:uncharacterized repeat protein (TIGR01451 family)
MVSESRSVTKGVSAAGWISTSQARPGETVTLWIQFLNNTNTTISNLRIIDFRASGLAEIGACWEGHVPSCMVGSRRAIPDRLNPGETVTVEAHLQPGKDSGIYRPSVVFSWTSATGTELRGVLSFGAVEVIATSWETRIPWARRVYRVFKDFAIPIVLALLAWYFKSGEDKRLEKRETWSKLVEQFVRDTQTYFLPIATRISPLLRHEWDSDAGGLRLFTFNLLVLLRRMKLLAQRIGGFHFRNRLGEQVAGATWNAFKMVLDDGLLTVREDGFADLMDAVDDSESFSVFEQKLSADTSLSDLRNEFENFLRKWRSSTMDPMSNYRCLLETLRLTIAYEINRPLELWYGEKPKADLAGLTKAGEAIKALTNSRAAPLQALFPGYIECLSKDS